MAAGLLLTELRGVMRFVQAVVEIDCAYKPTS